LGFAGVAGAGAGVSAGRGAAATSRAGAAGRDACASLWRLLEAGAVGGGSSAATGGAGGSTGGGAAARGAGAAGAAAAAAGGGAAGVGAATGAGAAGDGDATSGARAPCGRRRRIPASASAATTATPPTVASRRRPLVAPPAAGSTSPAAPLNVVEFVTTTGIGAGAWGRDARALGPTTTGVRLPAARSAASMAPIVANLSSRFFASAVSTTDSSAGAIWGFVARGGLGGCVRCMSTTSPKPGLTKGGAPTSIW
jgi:hypothetical protein